MGVLDVTNADRLTVIVNSPAILLIHRSFLRGPDDGGPLLT
jgi:hypothetical protein